MSKSAAITFASIIGLAFNFGLVSTVASVLPALAATALYAILVGGGLVLVLYVVVGALRPTSTHKSTVNPSPKQAVRVSYKSLR